MRISHRLLMVSLLLLLPVAAPAADDPEPDIILLDTGAEIRGIIINSIPGERVDVRRRDGSIVEIPYGRITAITNKAEYDQQRALLDAKRLEFRRSLEWRNCTRVGLAFGQGAPLVWASTASGFMLGEKLFVGAGIAWEHYDFVDALPIGVELHYLTGHVLSLATYAFASVAYSLAWHRCMREPKDGGLGSGYGGMAVDLGFGVRLPTARGPQPCLQLGVRVREGDGFFSEYDTTSDSYVLAAIGLGIMF